MGYLAPFLVNNRLRLVECSKLYGYVLKVRKYVREIDEISAGETDFNVRAKVKNLIPDVEEWQYSGRTLDRYYIFKFHKWSDRDMVRAFFKGEGFKTSLVDHVI